MPEHTIAENLTRLQNAKTAIGNAIAAKGGTVAAGDGLEDFASDIGTISNQYTAQDEGKIVSNGALVAQTAYPSEITANNTYDTTNYNSVTVNVGSAVDIIPLTIASGETGFAYFINEDSSKAILIAHILDYVSSGSRLKLTYPSSLNLAAYTLQYSFRYALTGHNTGYDVLKQTGIDYNARTLLFEINTSGPDKVVVVTFTK
jgi:hypothetical protein